MALQWPLTDEEVDDAVGLLGKMIAGGVSEIVQNRRHYMKTYERCLVGKELVTWMIEHSFASTREEALAHGSLLYRANLLWHVVDDHPFRDEQLFYRLGGEPPTEFSVSEGNSDDDSWLESEESVDVQLDHARGVLRHLLAAGAEELLGNRRYRLRTYRQCLVGEELVTWMVEQGIVGDRAHAVDECRKLNAVDLLVHVTRARAFHDDFLFYRFGNPDDDPRVVNEGVAAQCGTCLKGNRLVSTNKRGLALGGYDPISYFTEGKPEKGSPNITSTHLGATYRHVSEENRATFQCAPESYLPAAGGYCSWAAAAGMVAPASPRTYDVIGGRLYLNNNPFIRRAWLARADCAANTDARWRRMTAEAVGKLEE